MTWLEYHNLIWTQKEHVAIPEDGPVPCISTWLRQLTFEQNQTTDDAAFYFARELQWPPIHDHNVRYQLYFRCLFACSALRQMGEQHIPEVPGYDRELARKVLEMLLVQTWAQEGLEWADHKFPPAKPPMNPKRV